MKSINGINWKSNNIPERLILKKKQSFNISYLLSKIFLDKKYSDEEIYNSINNNHGKKLIYHNQDFEYASNFVIDCIKNNKRILIFGDYDVDGYSSTYLLYDFFGNFKVNCDYYVPDRFSDGYGPNKLLLKKLVNKANYDLVIFVDCGSNSFEEINFLEKCGLKAIVIDHHQMHSQRKFKKTVIINPLKNPNSANFPLFCATTLVYFFLRYLDKCLKKDKKVDFDKYLFFSAISTICDQMPLRGINKLIVNEGFKNFNLNSFNNLKKIININHKITTSDVAFSLGPILNSASRLGYSNLPLHLLLEKNNLNIDKISTKLMKLNEQRKKIQVKLINSIIKQTILISDEIIFNFKKNINEGLLGIIAANFVENYNKPSFLMTNSGNLIKCSSRSIDGYDIGKIFHYAYEKKIIIRGGGHAMAGGCVLKKNKINEFKKYLNIMYKKKIRNFNNTKYYIGDQNLESLKLFAKTDLKKLEPLGNNNHNPLFLIKNFRIIKFMVIKDTHLKFIIKNKYNKSCLCFAFNSVGTKLGYLLMNKKKDFDLIVQINNKIIQKNSDFNLIIKDAIA